MAAPVFNDGDFGIRLKNKLNESMAFVGGAAGEAARYVEQAQEAANEAGDTKTAVDQTAAQVADDADIAATAKRDAQDAATAANEKAGAADASARAAAADRQAVEEERQAVANLVETAGSIAGQVQESAGVATQGAAAAQEALSVVEQKALAVEQDRIASEIARNEAAQIAAGDLINDEAEREDMTFSSREVAARVQQVVAGLADPENGAEKVGFDGATLDKHLIGVVNAAAKGATPGGLANATAALQAAINTAKDSVVRIPPGVYLVDDLTISLKGSADVGGFRIIADGVTFVGGGKIIIDSCKQVVIQGLKARSHSLAFRGCWFSTFSDCWFKETIHGDAPGANFSSAYWNRFSGGSQQRIIIHENATEPFNAIGYDKVAFRGHGQQGFQQSVDYCIELRGNVNVQALNITGGDISYHNVAVEYISPNNTSDVEINYDGVYFDTKAPNRLLSREKTRITTTPACHAANDLTHTATMSGATQGASWTGHSGRGAGWQPHAPLNLIPNGNFAQSQAANNYAGTGFPIGALSGATVTEMPGGPAGRFLRITQAATTSNIVRFRSMPLPIAGRHTGAIILRNADAGDKTIQIGVAANYFQRTIKSDEWVYATLTTGAPLVEGTTPEVTINTTDGTPFSVDVAYVGMIFGEAPPLIVPQHPLTDKRQDTFSTRLRIGAGTDASRPIWTCGVGSPEGFVTAPRGSIYTREEGSAGQTLYVKESGSGNTGWAAK